MKTGTTLKTTTIDIARMYLSAGFSPIPLVPGEKRPSVRAWQNYAQEPMGWAETEQLFTGTDSIGLVCGFDGMEVLDIDAKHFDGDELNEFIAMLDEAAPGLRSKVILQHTRSGGQHWIYKCTEIEPNQKLARNFNGEVTFETRGIGGQIVVFPSPGYRVEGKISKIQFITPGERDVLFTCARGMDRPQLVATQSHYKTGALETDEQTPWGEFRTAHSALDILTSHGWTIIRENAKFIYVKRPGDTDAKTSGQIFKDSGLFWPWTTSTEFEAEEPYDGFQCFAVLEHGGDFQLAAKEIISRGYGKKYEITKHENIDDYDDEKLDEMAVRLRSMEVDSTISFERPPIAIDLVMGMESFIIGSLGNFTLVQGKAKSRKSYFVSALASSCVGTTMVAGHLRGFIGDRVVVYIDTEQGDFHAARTKRRIMHMAGLDVDANNDRLRYFKFRGLDRNHDRLTFTEYVLQSIENVGLVIIDGITDLSSKGVNDEEEATEIASRLLKWTSHYNCHIICVLHENKNDRNAKGHLGSYLVQKAESVIGIRRDEHNRDITIISPEYTRNIEFPEIQMVVGMDDDVQLDEHQHESFFKPQHVWEPDALKTLAGKIAGKSKGDAVEYVRDTESVQKKDAIKALNMMEDARIIEWTGGRPKIATLVNDKPNAPF